MIRKVLFFVLFTALSGAVMAQGETSPAQKKKGRPDIPGTFAIDLGFNLPTEKEDFNTSFFGSRNIDFYYFYDIQIGASQFSIHPGIGLGLERYKFNNDRTLGYVAGPNSPFDTLQMVPSPFSSLKKSQLITNYIDIPLEFRFSANPNDPNRSFKVSAGFKFGVLYDSFTKQKYREESETKKLKDKQNYNLNPIRYGVLLRIGVGNFSAYGYYGISPLFKDGKGPNDGEGIPGTINNWTVGLTLATF